MSDVSEQDLVQFLKDEDLVLLESKLSRFDLFKILNKTYDESTLSKILAWLMDPNETHGLGDYFLRTFLITTIEANHNEAVFNKKVFSLLNIHCLNFDDLVIQMEEVFGNGRRADITILDELNNIYILIENKVWAPESLDQTKSYSQQASIKYPNFAKLFIFLSPNQHTREPPVSKDFVQISYKDLVDVFNSVIKNKGGYLDEGVRILLNQTIKNIEENILSDSDIDKICLKL